MKILIDVKGLGPLIMRAAAEETLRTGKRVTVTSLVRDLISKELTRRKIKGAGNGKQEF